MTASPFLALGGAVDIAQSGVPSHYGNPLAEQRALVDGGALVDLSDRAVLSITGPDRLNWLNSLTSQSLLGLQPGESSETLLLDVMEGNPTLFMRADQVEAAWKIVMPILETWESRPPVDFPNYTPDSWGPEDVEALIARDGHNWITVPVQ